MPYKTKNSLLVTLIFLVDEIPIQKSSQGEVLVYQVVLVHKVHQGDVGRVGIKALIRAAYGV